jgi:CheY-like chemotaxis protein
LKLNEITVGLISQAIDYYNRIAFSGLPPKVPSPDFGSDFSVSIENFIEQFEDESTLEKGVKLRRYILRLGNSRYPFMKFVVQEHLIQDEFILSVDTHDDMFDMPSADYDGLQKIREFNRDIKLKIEDLWSLKKIPTLETLKQLIAGAGANRGDVEEEFRGKTILVVDDDQIMGDMLEEILKSKGFKVERLFDGIDAVREADPLRHDLIIMDNDMKIMDGKEACRILKEDPKRGSIPIMIASARIMDLSIINKADAYLVKPFHQDILFSFIKHIFRKENP